MNNLIYDFSILEQIKLPKIKYVKRKSLKGFYLLPDAEFNLMFTG